MVGLGVPGKEVQLDELEPTQKKRLEKIENLMAQDEATYGSR